MQCKAPGIGKKLKSIRHEGLNPIFKLTVSEVGCENSNQYTTKPFEVCLKKRLLICYPHANMWFQISRVLKLFKTSPPYLCMKAEYKRKAKYMLSSFAQWQYHSQWGLSEAWLLLIENYTQYPVLSTWNMAGMHNFSKLLRKLTFQIQLQSVKMWQLHWQA